MRVGIFSPYLDTLGGGERYILTAAEFFLKRKDDVDIFWDKDGNLQEMADRFGLGLNGVNFVPNIFSPKVRLLQRLWKTSRYDLVIILSDGSIPLSLAKTNWLHFQVPFKSSNRNMFINRLKMLFYSQILYNSNFTKNIVDQSFAISGKVIYPPVDVDNFHPAIKKEKIILSVGRFFTASHLSDFSPKKQQEMILAFKKFCKKDALKDWCLILLGACSKEHIGQLEKLKRLASGYPITLDTNVSFQRLQEIYSRSTIYWHAAGFSEDLETHSERAEHFGITTVEAMAAGCVPVVFAGGGQKEIVDDEKNGLFWNSLEELISQTNRLINDPHLMDKLSKNAVLRSKDFSKQKFNQALENLLE